MKFNHPVFIYTIHLLFWVTLLVLGRHAAIGDWGNYYYGAHANLAGYKTLIYDPGMFNQYVDSWQGEKTFLSYTQVPPLSLAIYFPFTFLKAGIAKLVFICFTYLICVFSIKYLFKKLQIDLLWSLLLPLLFFLPFRSNVDLGQSYFLLVALLAGGWLARENKKWMLAAFLFAFAIHLKIFPAIVLLWFLVEKDWKMFGATVGAVLLLFAASLPFVDWEIWKYYGTEILPRLAKGEITNTYATNYQSVQVLLKKLFVPDQLHNPGAPFNSTTLFQYGNITWSGIILVIAFLFSFDKKQPSFLRFSIWLTAGILISGYGSTYGLLLLIFPAIAIINHAIVSRNTKLMLLFLIALVGNIPVLWIMKFVFPFSFLRLLLTILLFAGMIYAFRPRWNKLALIALIIPFFSLVNDKMQDNGSSYLLNVEPSLLITDFFENVNENKIQYSYRDINGMQNGEFIFPEKMQYCEGVLSMDAHHILCKGKEYYFPDERISNALLINGKTLLYLSDKNRGVGFYTIRRMEIR